MLKSSTLSMALGLALLTGIGQVHSAQLYYTFTTQLPDEYYEIAGLPVSSEPASYVLMVDDSVTSSVRPDGTVQNYGHTVKYNMQWPYELHWISYYAELVSGPGLEFNTPGGSGPGYFGGYLYFDSAGIIDITDIGISGAGINGSFDVQIWGSNISQSAMATYDSFTQWLQENPFGSFVSEVTISNGDQYGRYFGQTISLAGISDTPPPAVVPVPTSFLLMGSGLAGLLIGKGRGKKQAHPLKRT